MTTTILAASESRSAGMKRPRWPQYAEVFELEFIAPGLVVGRFEGADPALPGIVDENIEAAELRNHPIPKPRNLRLIKHITGNGTNRITEFGPQRFKGRIQARLVPPTKRHLRAVHQHQADRRKADAGRSARHRNPLVGQSKIHVSPTAFIIAT